jgi:hypothetical protein
MMKKLLILSILMVTSVAHSETIDSFLCTPSKGFNPIDQELHDDQSDSVTILETPFLIPHVDAETQDFAAAFDTHQSAEAIAIPEPHTYMILGLFLLAMVILRKDQKDLRDLRDLRKGT